MSIRDDDEPCECLLARDPFYGPHTLGEHDTDGLDDILFAPKGD
jgi:hypothetical protein